MIEGDDSPESNGGILNPPHYVRPQCCTRFAWRQSRPAESAIVTSFGDHPAGRGLQAPSWRILPARTLSVRTHHLVRWVMIIDMN